MKVENVTVLSGVVQESRRLEEVKEKSGKSGSQTIFAGNMWGDYTLQDRIQQRIERAQKRALKMVGDAWDGDRKIDTEIAESKGRLSELQENNKAHRDEINECKRQSEELMKAYQVREDSTEQKDLELLKKANTPAATGEKQELTEEERERLAKIQENGLSEYQTRVLELYKRECDAKVAIHGNDLEIEMENAVIRGIRGERVKVHPVLDARQEAEGIMEAARDDIVGMVVQDSKDHLDEEQEEREEEAEKVEEKKEEMEEIRDERKEKEEEMEELIKDMPLDENMDQNQKLADIKRKVQDIMNEMNVAIEDIKGAQIDQSV